MRRLFPIVLLLTIAASRQALAQDADAKALYGDNCKKCHGVLGNPPQTMKKKYPKIVAFDAPCPSDTDAFLDRQGMGRACVVDAVRAAGESGG